MSQTPENEPKIADQPFSKPSAPGDVGAAGPELGRTEAWLTDLIKKKPIEIVALLVSLGALYFAFQANSISKDAKNLAARTYLLVEPQLIPTDQEPLASLAKNFGVSSDRKRYVAVYGKDETLTTVLWITVKNAGAHEAHDAKLHVIIDFIRPDHPDDAVLPITHEFDLGDLAPGQVIAQDVMASVSSEAGRESLPAATIQNLFETDQMLARVRFKTSYVNTAGDRIYSGSYFGTSRAGGALIGREVHKISSGANELNELQQRRNR
jgi:hypothetical protein